MNQYPDEGLRLVGCAVEVRVALDGAPAVAAEVHLCPGVGVGRELVVNLRVRAAAVTVERNRVGLEKHIGAIHDLDVERSVLEHHPGVVAVRDVDPAVAERRLEVDHADAAILVVHDHCAVTVVTERLAMDAVAVPGVVVLDERIDHLPALGEPDVGLDDS